jgi:D-serine deaminase-like pyridoxal phosphate-dependent protein
MSPPGRPQGEYRRAQTEGGRVSPPAARVGEAVSAVDTPALVIDLDALERNIARMADYARAQGMRLRPHAKTHKSAAIAKLQIAAGAVGVCVQKLSEAQALAVDSTLGVDRLATALKAAGTMVDVFVEVDVGHGRCGVAPTAAVGIAHQVVSHGLRLAGLQAYHGRAQHLRAAGERESAIQHAVGLARAAQAGITSAGIACPLVTGAGTGTYMLEAASGLYGELQAGSYVFMDRDYADNHAAPHSPAFEHALFVKSQVMSAGSSHVVVDAGHKSHAIDSGLPRVRGLDLEFVNGGDEHGILRRRGNDALPGLGDTVWLIPGHCDPTVNLHDHFVCVRGGLESGRVEAIWPVDARGCMR